MSRTRLEGLHDPAAVPQVAAPGLAAAVRILPADQKCTNLSAILRARLPTGSARRIRLYPRA